MTGMLISSICWRPTTVWLRLVKRTSAPPLCRRASRASAPEIASCVSSAPKTRPSPKCSGRLGWRTNQGSGMGNTYKYTKLYSGGSRNLLRVTCSTQSCRLLQLRLKWLDRRTSPMWPYMIPCLSVSLFFERNCALKRGLCNTVVFRISNISRRSILNFCWTLGCWRWPFPINLRATARNIWRCKGLYLKIEHNLE